MEVSSPASNQLQTETNKNEIGKKDVPLKRAHFSVLEDHQLKELVKLYGTEKPYVWELIASCMKGRSARQCRERYNLFLDEGIKKKEKWTSEEDEILLSKYQLLGPRWKEMEKFFTGRTSYNIKNRYSSLKRKEIKRLKYSKDESQFSMSNSSDDDKSEDFFFFESDFSDIFFDNI